MTELTTAELEDLGREVIGSFVGRENLSRVRVEPDLGYNDDPIYWFWILTGGRPANELLQGRWGDVGLALMDALRERGDMSWPHLRAPSPETWTKVWGD